jgi:chromosome segregation ATPase
MNTNAKIGEMIDRRQTMQVAIADFSTALDNLGTQITNEPVVIQAIDQRMAGQLLPALEKLDSSGRQFYANLTEVESAVNSLNSTALFRNRTGALDELGNYLSEFTTSLEQLDANFTALETMWIDRKSETVQTVVTALKQPLIKIDTQLSNTQTRLENLQVRLGTLQDELETEQKSLLQTITFVAVVLTLILVWLATSQVLAFRYGWERFKPLHTAKPTPSDQVQAEN